MNIVALVEEEGGCAAGKLGRLFGVGDDWGIASRIEAWCDGGVEEERIAVEIEAGFVEGVQGVAAIGGGYPLVEEEGGIAAIGARSAEAEGILAAAA